MQQAKATKTLVFQFDHVNAKIHVSIGLGPPPRTPVAHKGTGWDSLRKNKNPAGDCYLHESTTISFRFVLNFEILAVLPQK